MLTFPTRCVHGNSTTNVCSRRVLFPPCLFDHLIRSGTQQCVCARLRRNVETVYTQIFLMHARRAERFASSLESQTALVGTEHRSDITSHTDTAYACMYVAHMYAACKAARSETEMRNRPTTIAADEFRKDKSSSKRNSSDNNNNNENRLAHKSQHNDNV